MENEKIEVKKQRPNIELDMKKILMIVIPFGLILCIGFVFLLSGGDKQVNPVTQNAKLALEQNQKDKALEILNEGNEKSSIDAEGEELLAQLRAELYPLYLSDAQKAEQAEKYKIAHQKYLKALLAIPDDAEDRIALEESVSRTKDLLKKQERLQQDFTVYMETFQAAISDSNALLKNFKTQIDGIEVGSVTPEQLVANVKTKIASSNDIISDLDNGLFIQYPLLLDVHKTVISHVNFQHDMFLSSLEMTDANKKEMVEKLKNSFLKLKQEQVDIIQIFNILVEDNHLDIELKIEE